MRHRLWAGLSVGVVVALLSPLDHHTPAASAPNGQVVAPGQVTPIGPPRDARGESQTGTAKITGRVVAAEGGGPLRRVVVRAWGDALREGKAALTDAEGRYEIAELPAGRFSLTASKGSYVDIQYGQRSPFDQGRPVSLRAGEVLERIDFVLPRGSVVTGRLVDEFGDPMADAMVQVQRRRYVGGRSRLVPAGRIGTTNDIGQYRVFGLPPGEYYVSATVRPGMFLGAMPADTPSGYAPTYYPGTPNLHEAARVRVGLGEEVVADFQLLPVPTVRVSGTVLDSAGRPLALGIVRLTPRGDDVVLSSVGMMGGRVSQGSFTIAGVTPGEYHVIAQAADGPGTGVRELAVVPVSVGTAPLDGLLLTLGPGATLKGEVVLDGDASLQPNEVRIVAQMTEMTMGMAPATLNDDWTFELKGLHGRVEQIVAAQVAPGWTIASVVYGGADVTDAGFEVRGNDPSASLRVTLTQSAATLSGTVADARGSVLSDYTVVVFADDEDKWRLRSGRYVRSARPDQEGTFRVTGLPEGRYLVLATEHPVEDWQDPAVLESLRDTSTPLTLGKGEQKVVSIRLADR